MLSGCMYFLIPCQAIFTKLCCVFQDVIKTAAGLTLGAYMLWENRRRDLIQQSVGPAFDEHEGQRLSLLDKTEFVSRFENRLFVQRVTDVLYPSRKTRISDIH